MSHHQIWHAFYYDRSGPSVPCRSEVIEAASEEAAARVARSHLGECKRVSLEAAPWMQRKSRVIFAENERRRSYLH